MHVLVVEDDSRVARVIARALLDAGERVDVADTAQSGLVRAASDVYDVIVLDVMLPDGDGFQICRDLRQRGLRTPVLMLTARDAIPDRVRGLDAGADDYLIKPFAVEELLARLRALLRRGPAASGDRTFRVGDLVLDLDDRTARRDERAIELTAREFDLLVYLMRHAGQVLTKNQILDHVWGYDAATASNVVEAYVHYLRDKIDRGFARPLIRTMRGVGYMIKE
jgi:DNA-binding response OmpR family regulator